VTTTVQAEAPTSAAGPVPKWPTDWDQVLDTAIRTWRGEWTTNRVQQLYKARYGDSMHRADARAFLSRRAHQGVLRLNNRADARYYTLRTTRGNQS
jgi:hypothetical protein